MLYQLHWQFDEDEETFGFDGDGAFFLKDIEVK